MSRDLSWNRWAGAWTTIFIVQRWGCMHAGFKRQVTGAILSGRNVFGSLEARTSWSSPNQELSPLSRSSDARLVDENRRASNVTRRPLDAT